MIHPSFLLRSDSRSREFAAPLHSQGKIENDWGISIFPCLAKLFNWRTFAKPSVFITLLSLMGCTQGLLLFYFRNTSEIWAKQYNISKDSLDLILCVDDFLVAFVALPITYWAISSHHVVWISSLTIIHGIYSILLFLPEIYFAIFQTSSLIHLCRSETFNQYGNIHYGMLAILIIYQFISAAAFIGFFTLGLVYIDSNSMKKKYVLAIVLASYEFGKLLGMYLSWIPLFHSSHRIFRNYLWQCTCMTYIMLGVMIAMFPKILPEVLIKKLAVSLLESANGNTTNKLAKRSSHYFFKTIRKILANRIVLFSIISTVTIQAALLNFKTYEKYFKQSKFFINDNFEVFGFNNPSFSLNFTLNIAKQPFIILCIILTGFLISRSRMRIKYLVLWNIVAFSLSTLLFCTYIFVKCENDDLTQLIPSCSVDCGCSLEGTFNPVCMNGKTYYSPCHAGCKVSEFSYNDDYQFYTNCSCGSFERNARDGSCHSNECEMIYQFTQLCYIISDGLLSTTVFTNIVIILLSVERIDRSLALALEMTFLSLVPFIPIRLFFELISGKYCSYRYKKKCGVFSEKFSIFLIKTTGFLMVFGTIMHMFLLSLDLDKPHKRKRSNIEISSEGIIEQSRNEFLESHF